jgi:hypothetical protein
VDASSSASLAAYINVLTHKEHGPNATSKIAEGLYWYVADGVAILLNLTGADMEKLL